jgi:hypothetical protein
VQASKGISQFFNGGTICHFLEMEDNVYAGMTVDHEPVVTEKYPDARGAEATSIEITQERRMGVLWR